MASYFRVFPWDQRAADGALFSPSYVPPTTGRGRFDLSWDRSPVLYVAETAEHAVAELIQPWRGRTLDHRHLRHAGRPLSLVTVELADEAQAGILDLCDPAALVGIASAPDRVASRRRDVTQPVAATAWDLGHTGIRWWSSFWGDWHGSVLFTARMDGELTFGVPEPLTRDSLPLRTAAGLLGITV